MQIYRSARDLFGGDAHVTMPMLRSRTLPLFPITQLRGVAHG